MRNSRDVDERNVASGVHSGVKLAAGGAAAAPTTAGRSILKSGGTARSAGTFEMHPVLAQGLEPAFPDLGQHGWESG